MTRPHLRRSGGAALALAAIAAAPVPTALDIVGAGRKPVQMSLADVAALPRETVSWTLKAKVLACEGPRLTDVLARAGAETGDRLRGKALTRVVVATGGDRYRVAFTLGELDRGLGDARIIVADRCDGAALPAADGPLRLVAVGDAHGARSVRQLFKLEVIP